MKPREQPTGHGRGIAGLILLVGFALTGWVAYDAFAFLDRLPLAQYRRVPSHQWMATAQAIANSTTVVSHAWDLGVGSRVIRDAYLQRGPIAQARTVINNIARTVPRPLARLQLATILLIEADNEPADERWSRVAELLPGLEHADFSHNLDPLLHTVAGGFERLGVDGSVAMERAFENFGYAHGPFLQILAPQLMRLVEERSAAGDEQAAATCRAILTRILTQWVDEPGPVGLRLLAAELTGKLVEAAAISDPQFVAIAQRAKEWRTQYRMRAAALPGNMLGVSSVPQPCVATQRNLVTRIVFASWLIVAMLVLGLLAVVGAWPVLHANALDHALLRWTGRGLVMGMVLTVLGLALISRTEIAGDDIRAGFPSQNYTGAHTWIVASVAILLNVLAGAIPVSGKRSSSALCRTGATCMTGWLILALASAVAVRGAESARIAHSAAVVSSYQDRGAAVVGGSVSEIVAESP